MGIEHQLRVAGRIGEDHPFLAGGIYLPQKWVVGTEPR
jgi:hypothetical protein